MENNSDSESLAGQFETPIADRNGQIAMMKSNNKPHKSKKHQVAQ